ncbi:hypothetical protein [Microbacterium oxydans]|uniref:hypothetical protein n=1 Tax=Microbacterium oxydans TaxID=82380 RepID=UPI0037C57361
MTDTEKKSWAHALLYLYMAPVTLCALYVFVGNPPAADGFIRVIGWYFIGVTLAYGLVASWRVAYLSGRRKR